MGKTSQLMNVQIVEREEGRGGGGVGRGEGDRETEREKSGERRLKCFQKQVNYTI